MTTHNITPETSLDGYCRCYQKCSTLTPEAWLYTWKNIKSDNWIPACGGTEVPFFSRGGRKLLYVYQPSTGNHAYLDMGKDMLLTDDELHLFIDGKL